MNSSEHNLLCEQEAKELMLWLEGYIEGLGGKTGDISVVFCINERTDNLLRSWQERGRRVRAA